MPITNILINCNLIQDKLQTSYQTKHLCVFEIIKCKENLQKKKKFYCTGQKFDNKEATGIFRVLIRMMMTMMGKCFDCSMDSFFKNKISFILPTHLMFPNRRRMIFPFRHRCNASRVFPLFYIKMSEWRDIRKIPPDYE